MREMDLVLGRFADARLPDLPETQVAELEALLDVPDPELFAWVSEARPTPARFETELLAAIRAFHAAEPAAQDGTRS